MDTALKLCPLLLIRPSELRAMEWQEIGDDHVWRIPGRKMKRRRDHTVPLSTQALVLIQSMQRVNGHRQYVFASPTHPRFRKTRCCSACAGSASPKRWAPLTGSARTLLDEELAYKKDWIEHQLAHKVREPDGHNRTEFLRERKTMMQAWSDYSLQYVQPSSDHAPNVQRIREIP